MCRRGGCGDQADQASPDGEWCALHGRLVAAGQLTAAAMPRQTAFHRRNS